ncbi:cytochrome c biogenesis protein CcdA [Cesiribacter sp. SM1]|uniref:protein-disulfide reductase DsbD family protein n=1 Tax=Cesiribacter sp. SM1 TaxID=2861196 RepID=UPI001CD5CC4C|nr:cytochrome c biogenesis protein CcdA [Cesiribacter sp. SM1]
MKSLFVMLGLLLAGLSGTAQVLKPAEWRYYPAKSVVEQGEEVDLFLEASLEEGWQLYATDMDPELGPLPAAVTFVSDPDYALVGEVESVRPSRRFDSLWEGEVSYFEGKSLFRQRVRILGKDPRIRGTLTYQLCSKENGRCVMGEEEFRFSSLQVTQATPRPRLQEEREMEQIPAGEPARGAGADATPVAPATDSSGQKVSTSAAVDTPAVPHQGGSVGYPADTSPISKGITNGMSLWGFALLAFVAGLAALLTPCVFPIIPLTVAYFSFQEPRASTGSGSVHSGSLHSGSLRRKAVSRALLYGLSVVLIYTGVGTGLAWLNGPAFANFLSTHWLPNLLFFGIFTLFALSFLGMFEIRLPLSWINRADRQADKGGLPGIFFMALTLVLVSFSCTGPMVGSLLVASAGGAVLLPLVGMAAFGLAFALPFTLLALFPEGLKKLPGSGAWLHTVKVVLGFLELALGLKFLSVADQVYGWGLLDRPLYLSLWIAIFSAMGLYLLGKLPLAQESGTAPGVPDRPGVLRLLLAIGVFAFVLYLLPGLFGAPLAPLAGYLPPHKQTANWSSGWGGTDSSEAPPAAGMCEPPRGGERLSWPHGLQGYFELEQALACAREQGKPLFITFTGHGCVNCREMEARVWSDPRVLERLRKDYVLLALYVDDKTELPETRWYRSTFDGRIKKSIGMQNADYQVRRFGANAQPFYAVLDPETGNSLLAPTAYDLSVPRFLEFLEQGTAAWQKVRQEVNSSRKQALSAVFAEQSTAY